MKDSTVQEKIGASLRTNEFAILLESEGNISLHTSGAGSVGNPVRCPQGAAAQGQPDLRLTNG